MRLILHTIMIVIKDLLGRINIKRQLQEPKGANPQRVSTDIITEIKLLYSGRMA